MSVDIPQRTDRPTPQQRILNILEGGVRNWNELKALTNSTDDRLGINLCELFGLRKIWTAHENDVRVYGLERRTGVVPRASHQP